jgi:hypothetical protein
MKTNGLARRLRPIVIAEPSAVRSFSSVARVVRSCTLNATLASPWRTGEDGFVIAKEASTSGAACTDHDPAWASVATGVRPDVIDHASRVPDSNPSANTAAGSARATAEPPTGASAVADVPSDAVP